MIKNVGAVTWCSGANGKCKGEASKGAFASSSNSLIGSTTSDAVGASIKLLTNGNYVVVGGANWDNGAIQNAGFATAVMISCHYTASTSCPTGVIMISLARNDD